VNTRNPRPVYPRLFRDASSNSQYRSLTILCLFLLAATVSAVSVSASSHNESRGDSRSLAEANRLLEEEIKLAAHPQIYLVIDLSQNVILVKGRGVELYRLLIASWRFSKGASVAGVLRLQARPPLIRPKATPVEDTPPVIELKDMPQAYDLLFQPPLTIVVAPLAQEELWLWAKSRIREWWERLTLAAGFASDRESIAGPRLRLTLSQDAARSLAWVVTDGMALIITQPTQRN
jgi:hypothetical protein